MKNKARKSRSFSILSLIFLCLMASGVIRMGAVGSSIANANTDLAGRYSPTGSFDADTSELSRLMEDLSNQNEELEKRKEALDMREEKLREVEQRIQDELVRLEEAEQALRRTVAEVDAASEADVASLVLVYENMKPKDAAPLFEQMDAEFAAGFLGQMSAAAAAGIMSGLSSEKAYEVSVVLAGRNSEAGQ